MSMSGRYRRQPDAPPMDEDDVMSRLAHRGRPDERGRAPYADYAPSAPEPFRHASYDDGAAVPARHRGLDWPEPEPARAHDPYHGTEAYRQPRDEYPAEAWPHAQGRYPAAGREWREGTYVKAAYPDGAWPAASSSSSNHYEPRGYDERPPDDFRGGRADARGYGHDRDAYAQHRDEQRDSGWASRKRGSDRNHGARQWGGEPRNDAGPPSALPSAEDRSWQPAPSWQATRRGNDTQNSRYQGGRGGNMNAYPNQKKSGKKKKNKNNRPPQGREHDEEGGAVNNWQRSDAGYNGSGAQYRRQGRDSRSRSRSVSSYSSRRSSRRRSRSGSRSPRRRQRSPSGRSPHKGRSQKNGTRPRRSPSRSRSPGRGRRRGRSVSSGSSRSRSRSRSVSRSPEVKPKAVHRLPPATSLHNITLSRVALNMAPPRVEELTQPAFEPSALQSQPAVAPSPARSQRSPPRSPALHQEESRARSVEHPPPSSEHASPARSSTGTQQTAPASGSTLPTSPLEAARSKQNLKPAEPPGSNSKKRGFPADDDEVDSAREAASATEAVFAPSASEYAMAPVGQSPRATRDGAANGTGFAEPPAAPPSRTRVDPVVKPAKPGQLYSIISQVGEGTFGKVYKARNTANGMHVALKRIRMEAERDGFPVTAMREIKLLQSLRHDNVVQLYEMMVSDGNVYMVFEYSDHDLTGVLSQTQLSFSDAHLKSFCQQMLQGLAYLHHKSVVHRDIKGSNILVNHRGELKLADFGLARWYQKRRRSDYTNRVITLWYRPPELLFGATVYGPEVDMWSAGCIMLELYTKKPIFQGNDEIHQLDVIYKILGTLTPERWSGVGDMPWYELVKPKELLSNHFRTLFQKWLSPAALDLAEWLLAYDPQSRATASQALGAPYFTSEEPAPELPTCISQLEGEWHELETKRERAKKRRKTDGAPGSQA